MAKVAKRTAARPHRAAQLLDPEVTSTEESQPFISQEDKSNVGMLGDWLLQERVIAQRLREKSDTQAIMIRELRAHILGQSGRIYRLTKRLETVREEALEEILEVLGKENPNLA